MRAMGSKDQDPERGGRMGRIPEVGVHWAVRGDDDPERLYLDEDESSS